MRIKWLQSTGNVLFIYVCIHMFPRCPQGCRTPNHLTRERVPPSVPTRRTCCTDILLRPFPKKSNEILRICISMLSQKQSYRFLFHMGSICWCYTPLMFWSLLAWHPAFFWENMINHSLDASKVHFETDNVESDQVDLWHWDSRVNAIFEQCF